MNRKIPRIVLILLMTVLLVFALFACTPSSPNDEPPVDEPPVEDVPSDVPSSSTAINKGQIFSDIKTGLLNAGSRIEDVEVGTRYVDSEYVLRVTIGQKEVNVGIEYQANYSVERAQDSEIMVRIFDYKEESNTGFVYYKANTLYLQSGSEYLKIENFGSTSLFELFYEVVTKLDMQQTLFSVDFADNMEAMANFAETQKISKIILSDNEYNVTVKEINLDQLKSQVNDFISDNIASLGTRFDALTSKLLGFELSDLGRVQIGLFTATELLTVMETDDGGDNYLTDFHINFAGNQSNNIDKYYLDVKYSTSYSKGDIRLTKFDDPDTNNYETTNVSSLYFKGDIFVPYLDETFNAELKGNLNSNDNAENEILFEIVNRTENQGNSFSIDERMFTLSYYDGVMYVDAKGLLENYVGNILDYEALNLPRIEIQGVNLSNELKTLIADTLGMLKFDFDISDIFASSGGAETDEEGNSTFEVLINKVRSEDGVFYILIDNEFIVEVLGSEQKTVIEYIADTLGVSTELVNDILELGYFNDLKLELAWNTLNDSIIVTTYLGDTMLFKLSLTSQEVPDDGLYIEFPDVKEIGYFDTFKEFKNPETKNFHMTASVRTQGREFTDVSSLMGLFIGDISGKNTPFNLSIGDKIMMEMDLWETAGEFYVDAYFYMENGTALFELNSDVNDPETLLVNNFTLGVKYKLPRAEVLDLIGVLAENKEIWEFDSIVNALEVLARDATIEKRDDDILLKISPYTVNGVSYDPLKEIFGVENFIAGISVQVNFQAPSGQPDANDYVTPVIVLEDEVSWTSIYEATWLETATVVFGDKPIDFKLTFEGDSAKLVTGVYEYRPEARLFGQKASYKLIFTDVVNGTSVVEALYEPHMIIDPSIENPIPEEIEVVYTNGIRGFLPYEIEGFPYNNGNITQLMGGMREADYEVVIGRGSIAESRFTLRLEVLGRNIKVADGEYYGSTPIVARVTIDPYQYSLEKKEADILGEKYYPFKYREEGDGSGLAPTTLALQFYAYQNSQEVRTVYLEKFDWGFDETKITYNGGEYTVVQKFNTIDVAIVITVEAKEVAYVQIDDDVNGYYTIDSLVASTYVIPSITNDQNEVRIYFETGHYRIIGLEPQGFVSTDPYCDGYYDQALSWSITEANNVTIDRSIHPLDSGRTNITTCTFGDDTVGKQNVTLTVTCPTRVIGTRADTTLAITSVSYDATGNVDNSQTTYEAIKVSLASFSRDASVESSYFEFDPYSDAESNVNLPGSVFVFVEYRGSKQIREYKVKWLTVEGENVIDENGKILNAFSEETYLRVRGVIGNYDVEGGLTQTLEMVIHNKSAGFQNVLMLDENQLILGMVVTKRYNEQGTLIDSNDVVTKEAYRRYFIEGLNPYDVVELPKYVQLQFPAGSGIEDKIYPANWLLADGVTPAQGYLVNPEGGEHTVHTVVQGSGDVGALGQNVELTLVYEKKNVVQHRIYGVSDSADEGYLIQEDTLDGSGNRVTVYYVAVDTYKADSLELYERLSNGLNKVGIGFVDGTRVDDVDITWDNLEAFLACLQSPLGSSAYYNNGYFMGEALNDDIIFLRGTIRAGSVQETSVRMGFKVAPRVLGEMNFTNFDENFAVPDANGVQSVIIKVETQRANAKVEGATTTVTMEGKNAINITFNKIFALRGEYEGTDGALEQGLCTPRQYLDYLFSNVSLSFSDAVRNNKLEIPEFEGFDDFVYGNISEIIPGVSINDTHVIFRFQISKLSEGSCRQTFDVTLTYQKDATVIGALDAASEAIEIFDENGYPRFETNDGYVLDTSYSVSYVHSGTVTYTDLVWIAEETVSSMVNDEVIGQGEVVKNIKYDFFNFTSTRIVKLSTTLPNGQKFLRNLNFYAKNVNLVNYETEDEGLYKIEKGTLVINNVYDYLPLDNFIGNVATTIVPTQSASFISSYQIKFTLVDGWKPTAQFADDQDPDKFSTAKLSEAITSEGLNATLLATGTIKGYNGETQTINLYVRVQTLSSGQTTHKDYDIKGNNLVFDQYALPGEGTFKLPKDIKVTFSSGVSYQFKATDAVKYEIRNKDDVNKFTEVTELTYNNVGHTLSADYGYDANDPIYLRVTLPDGNNSLRLIVTFPSRVLENVYYTSKQSESANAEVSGVYYIDPYDRATFKLPTTASFKYVGVEETVTQNVSWTMADENAPFTLNSDGSYVYDGGDYKGAGYLFYSKLQSFDDVDKEQYFIMQVYVLNRDFVGSTAPANIYPSEYLVENPFETLVNDLPHLLEEGDFKKLDALRTISASESQALLNLYNALKNDDSIVQYYADILNDDSPVYVEAYLSGLVPIVPDVLWKIEKNGVRVDLVNDDILVKGGFSYNIYGYVGAGTDDARTEGAVIAMVLYADSWQFKEIKGLNDNVVEFNDYTMDSLMDSFEIVFTVTNLSGTVERSVTFYPEVYADTDAKSKKTILWNKNDWTNSAELGSVTFFNKFKTEEVNKISTQTIYKFDAQMVGIDEITFGYGEGYAKSGYVELVVDPLNPVIPTTALARGALQIEGETEAPVIDLGEVNINWTVTDASNEASIYHMTLAGGLKQVECTVESSGINTNKFPFIVRVIYLDRTPTTVSTEEAGFSNRAPNGIYYDLLTHNVDANNEIVKQYAFVIDPTPSDMNLFNAEGKTNARYWDAAKQEYVNSNYMLPKTLHLVFDNKYDINDVATEGLRKLGYDLYLNDIEWVLSRDITLTGTAESGGAITAKIRKFTVQYVADGEVYRSDVYEYGDESTVLGKSLDLLLTTINRRVEYTFIGSEDNILSTEIEYTTANGQKGYYQKAAEGYYIDPYYVAFPEAISIKFTGSALPYTQTNIEWAYDYDYITQPNVISGQIGAEGMFIMGTLKVYGAELDIQFPIRPRNIPITFVTDKGEETTEPLKGGTLYLLKGVPVKEQLPDKLYYRFEYDDGTYEIAAAPLKFLTTNAISTDFEGRTYSNVPANLGTVDDNNIEFTMKVIDPKLFVLKEKLLSSSIGNQVSTQAIYTNGGFVYDFIAVGVNAAGSYVAGPETSILPDKVVVSEDGEYMDIVGIEYDVENGVAIINCRYTFLSFSDSSRLSGDVYGNGENSDKMFLSFTVPIKTYSYNWIESSEAVFEKTVYEFELGSTISASDMPLTTDGIAPIWDLSTLNPNRAGEYVATCHFKNAYGKTIIGEVKVIIKRRDLHADDITWVDYDGVDFLDRIYSGETLQIEKYLEFGDFLRDDGTYGMLEGYTVMYSLDGRKNWQYEQPTTVKEAGASDYYVRIIINDSDDYNYTGNVDYRMVIEKCVIDENEIYFHDGDFERIVETPYYYVGSNGAMISTNVKQIEFTYDGYEKIPDIAGIPRGATYVLQYARYNPESTNQAYNSAIRPVNSGVYIMKMEFVADQRNYTINQNAEFIIVIKINKTNVNYTLETVMPYTGEYFDVKVNGLPDVLGDINVVYQYTNAATNQTLPIGSKLRDAGEYVVTVKIYGGQNYPSANLDPSEGESLIYNALRNQRITVTKRKVILTVGTVESEYLSPLKPLNSSLTITTPDGEPGLIGKYDTMSVFGDLSVKWTGGELTYKHMVGSYPLTLVNQELTHNNYEFVEIRGGVYNIIAAQANTRVIENKAELDEAINLLTDGATVRWYLKAGNYGTITINKNASVSIIGSYDIRLEAETIAVNFDQIIVEKGAVLLDIIAFKDIANSSSVKVMQGASSLTVSRSRFVKSSAMLVGSSAISTEIGYTDTLYVSDSYFEGFGTALYLQGGNLELRTSTLYNNKNGVYVQTGDLVLDSNEFVANRGVAVNILNSKATLSIFDNVFDSNDTAIESLAPLRNDLDVQNTFRQNSN